MVIENLLGSESTTPFVTEDPLFSVVRSGLEGDLKKKEEIKRLFATSLTSQVDSIVGVRSEDVLTFLDALVKGDIALNRNDLNIRAKSDGWFYMTGSFTSSYYDLHPEHKGSPPFETFRDITQTNASIYAEDSAFGAAFARNVIPVLKPGWFDEAKEIVFHETSTFSTKEDYLKLNDDSLILEGLISLFHRSLQEVPLDDPLNKVLAPHLKYRYQVLRKISSLIDKHVNAVSVFEFLRQVIQERGGIIVGFNEHIIQGDVVSDAHRDGEILHCSGEIAVYPTSHYISLHSSVSAIESLGLYEDRVLNFLGLG